MLQEDTVVKSLEAAREAARRAVEGTYDGTCSVVEYRDVTDGTTKLTRKQEVAVLENQPCKLSFEALSAAGQTETAAKISQGLKLFLAPEAAVAPGSKVIVEQNGMTGEYSASGVPALYSSHQEIVLGLFRGWA